MNGKFKYSCYKKESNIYEKWKKNNIKGDYNSNELNSN